jgi:cysteine desulfurase / selenocysteine lyase
LRGPRGTALLGVRRDTIGMLEPPFLDLQAISRADADTYVPPVRKLGALYHQPDRIGRRRRYAMRVGIAAIEARVKALGAPRRQELAKRPGTSVHDLGVEQCGIVTFLKEGEAPGQTCDRLSAMNNNGQTRTFGALYDIFQLKSLAFARQAQRMFA